MSYTKATTLYLWEQINKVIGDYYIANSFKTGGLINSSNAHYLGFFPVSDCDDNNSTANPIAGDVSKTSFILRSRLAIFSFFYIFLFAVVSYRLFDVALINNSDESYIAYNHNLNADGYQRQFARGNILDRNGVPIATMLATSSLYADCKYVYNPKETAIRISNVLGLGNKEKNRLIKKLSTKRRFVWISKHITPEKKAKIIELGLTGINFIKSQKRFYPYANITSHLLGYTNIDNFGKAGIEASFDEKLKVPGYQLQTSIDIRIQAAVHQELRKAVGKYKAKAANAIVMDTKSGEVIAMVSINDFNPNKKINPKQKNYFDINSMGIYEHGSVMKIFNTALALEGGKATLHKYYNATKPLRLAGFTISDFRAKNRWLSVKDIFRHSSNVGSALMALEVGKEKQRDFFEKLNLIDPLETELPYSPEPGYPKIWREANTATISYGYGVSNTPLQFIAAANAIINDGKFVVPKFTKINGYANANANIDAGTNTDYKNVKNVISKRTSSQMRALMYYTVESGSGRYAKVPKYIVAGKTGTANIRVNGKYQKDQHKNRTSFFAFIGESLNDPKYSILVSLDEPKALKSTFGYSASGWNAAPTAGNIIRRIINITGLKPTAYKIQSKKSDIQSLIKLASYKK